MSKTETPELRRILSKMKNGMEGIKSRRDPTVAIGWKIHRGERKKKKRMKMKEESLYELWSNSKPTLQVLSLIQITR